jgi:hypothetical protein
MAQAKIQKYENFVDTKLKPDLVEALALRYFVWVVWFVLLLKIGSPAYFKNTFILYFIFYFVKGLATE